MRTHRTTFLTALLAVAGGLAGCNNSSSSGNTNLESFATDLIQNQTTESGEPVSIEGRTFVLDEDEGAFDAVLPLDGGPTVE